MRRWGIAAILLLCLLLAGATACSPIGGEQVSVSRLAEVVRGDLTVSVSGSGNVEVTNEIKLAFGIGGKIDKIYVEEGDKVRKGDVLAKLEIDDLELALTQAELALAQAEVAVTQAEVAQAQTEVAQSQAEVAQSQAEVGQLQAGVALAQTEVARTQAEVTLEAAKFDLDRMKDVQELKDKIEEAELDVKYAESMLKWAERTKDYYAANYWAEVLGSELPVSHPYYYQGPYGLRTELAELKQDLVELLAEDEYASLPVASLTINEVRIKALQVKAAEQSLEQAEQNVEQAERNVEQAKKNVEQAKKNVDYYKKSLEYAEQNVEYTKKSVEYAEKSVVHARKQLDDAVITSPFDGLIASVDAKEADIIPPPTLTTLPVIHLVDPTSMELKVEVDEIDIPSVKINQKAVISLDALPDVQFEGKVTAISLLATEKSGIILYEVNIGFDLPPGSGIKIGMSATADMILEERTNVLLIPSRAISQDSKGNNIVRVKVDDQIAERTVVTGISDDFQTEIISGLNEGDEIEVVTKVKADSGFGF